jgi:pimeloyl-ACP methyl ester carboxylesterase
MLYNGFHFYRNSVSRFFTLFPFRPLAVTSTGKSPAKYLTYWYRPHLSVTKLPILFIHGIGVGLYPYTNFLRDFSRGGVSDGDDTRVGIVAIEIMAVSSRITHHAFDRHTLVKEIRQILQHHGWSKCVLVGHSYGTVICTHLLKSPQASPLIGPVALIDPICFLLHLPDVAYNFMARRPVSAKELVLWYFGSKDIGVAHTLSRHFFWSENILWKEELGVNDGQRTVTVVLSGNDDIIDAQTVRRYLTTSSLIASAVHDKAIKKAGGIEKDVEINLVNEAAGTSVNTSVSGSGLQVIWFERCHHGQAFDFETTRNAVIRAIRATNSIYGHI